LCHLAPFCAPNGTGVGGALHRVFHVAVGVVGRVGAGRLDQREAVVSDDPHAAGVDHFAEACNRDDALSDRDRRSHWATSVQIARLDAYIRESVKCAPLIRPHSTIQTFFPTSNMNPQVTPTLHLTGYLGL